MLSNVSANVSTVRLFRYDHDDGKAYDRSDELMEPVTALELAVAGVRYGKGDGRLATRARRGGLAAFAEVFEQLRQPDRDQVSAEAEALTTQGVSAVLLGSPDYPASLAALRNAPSCLFYRGPRELLYGPGIGMCGSRNASPDGLRAAEACGEVAADHGIAVVSGYARGVDMSTHVSSLAAGGTTVIVLPEGISNFRIRRGPFAENWDPARALVVSQFSPSRPWSAATAMSRNSVIIGLSRALVVVEAQDKGGTFAAGTKALDLNRRVFALSFADNPPGNAVLLQRGAVAVRSRTELAEYLQQLAADPVGIQLSLL